MKTKITFLATVFYCLLLQAQNIEFTFANTQTTNDGTDDFYETDIMIAAIDGQADFKLGQGLLYINYNVAAFGSNIYTNGDAEVSYPNPDYILGDVNGFPYYNSFSLVDNTASRIAFSFQQGISSGSMTTENVTSLPKRLFHLKIRFTNSALDPMIVFEDNEMQPPGVDQGRDQFYTACGPATSGFPDCGAEPGNQFLNAVFISNGGTLSNNNIEISMGFSVYPNPAKDKVNIVFKNTIENIEVYDILGKQVKVLESTNEVDVSDLKSGIYMFKIWIGKQVLTKKIVVE